MEEACDCQQGFGKSKKCRQELGYGGIDKAKRLLRVQGGVRFVGITILL